MATKKRMQPAVRYLRYELTNSGTADTETSHFIDLANDLSKVNRRLYRQGRDYHVKKITIVSSNTPNGGNRISFSTAPNSWITQKAWQRGFKLWNEMNKDATRAAANDMSGKFADYKIYLSYDMQTGTVLTPKDNGGNNANSGDWDYAKMVSPDGTTSADQFLVHMLGDHVGTGGAWTSVGLVESYGDSRATVDTDQPNVPGAASNDPLLNLFDHGTVVDEIVNNLEGDNDSAPYGTVNYSGGAGNHPKPIVVQDTTIVDGRATVGGFIARCGLIEIEAKSAVPSDVFSVLVELAPGPYRGIAAEVI